MPRLPDDTSLGQRPIARGQTPVVGVRTGQVEAAVSGLGESVAAFGTVADEVQKRDDLEAVSKTMTAFEDEQRQYFVEGEKAVFRRQGDNAKGASVESAQWWDETSTKYAGQLQNDRQRQAFSEMLRRQRGSVLDSVAKYEVKQKDAVLADSLSARAKSAVERGAAMHAVPEAVAQSRVDMVDALTAAGKAYGWAPEVLDAKKQEALTSFHKAQISVKIDRDPDGALAYYAANKDEISALERQSIENALGQGSLRLNSQKESDRIAGYGAGLSEQLRMARAIKDPELRDEVERRVKVRFQESELLQQEQQENIMISAANLIDQNGTTDAVPVSQWSALTPSQRASLASYAEAKRTRKPIQTDQKTWYDLYQMGGDNPQEFARVNLLEYRDRLSDTDFQELAKLQKDVREQGAMSAAGSTAFDVGVLEPKTIADTVMRSIDIDPKKDEEAAASFYFALNRELRNWKLANDPDNKLKNVPREQVESIAKRLALEVKVPRDSFFGDRKARLFEVDPREADSTYVDLDVDDVPDIDRQQITEALQALGATITDDLVVKYYLKSQGLKAKND